MVSDYHHWMFCSHKIVLPLFQCLNNSEKLSVVDIVVSFCGREGSGMVGARMEVSIGIPLHEYSSRGGKRGICHDKQQFGSVWHFDHQGGQECLLEFDKGIVLFFSPVEGYPLFC